MFSEYHKKILYQGSRIGWLFEHVLVFFSWFIVAEKNMYISRGERIACLVAYVCNIYFFDKSSSLEKKLVLSSFLLPLLVCFILGWLGFIWWSCRHIKNFLYINACQLEHHYFSWNFRFHKSTNLTSYEYVCTYRTFPSFFVWLSPSLKKCFFRRAPFLVKKYILGEYLRVYVTTMISSCGAEHWGTEKVSSSCQT